MRTLTTKKLNDIATALNLVDVIRHAYSLVKDSGEDVYLKAGEYLVTTYPRGCEILYQGGKIFVGGSAQDVAIAMQQMKTRIDAVTQRGVSKNARVRIRYTKAERERLRIPKARKMKKGSK